MVHSPFQILFVNYPKVEDVPMFLGIPGRETPTFMEKSNLPHLSNYLAVPVTL